MTKLTTERLEKFVNYIKTDGMCDITDHQVALALRQLLAYEQAAKNPVAWVVGDEEIADFKNGREVCVMRDCDDEQLDYLPLYAAPVLPKQPELLSIGELLHRLEEQTGEKWVEEFAQPVSEPYKLNGWISVADRLPSEFGRYLCYVEEQNDLGKSHYQWNCSWNGDVFSDSSLTGRVTHWMPLPAAPSQESE